MLLSLYNIFQIQCCRMFAKKALIKMLLFSVHFHSEKKQSIEPRNPLILNNKVLLNFSFRLATVENVKEKNESTD